MGAEQSAIPTAPTQTRRAWLGPGAVFAICFVGFAWRLGAEPEFVDESSAIATSYYYRLLVRGDFHHVDWLHPGAYDHVPVFKYLIGIALRLSGQQPPDSIGLWEQWMQRTFEPSQNAGTQRALRPARLLSVLGAAAGCALIYLVGRAWIGAKTGLAAAALLALSPLYYAHARRAMADDWTQAFGLACLWAFLRAVRLIEAKPISWGRLATWLTASGLGGALAAGARLNGAVLLVALALFTAVVLALAALRRTDRATGWTVAGRLAAMTAIVGTLALLVFVALNPFFYARPDLAAVTARDADGNLSIAGQRRPAAYADELARTAGTGVLGRFRLMLQHRTEGLKAGIAAFPHLAIPSATGRLDAIIWEGFGRWFAFGAGAYPGDKDRHSADYRVVAGWGVARVIFWLLAALLGLRVAYREGRDRWRRGAIPTEWLLIAWTAVEIGVLLRNLVVDFDRYYLGVVTIASLLVPYGIAGSMKRVHDQLVLRPPSPEARS